VVGAKVRMRVWTVTCGEARTVLSSTTPNVPPPPEENLIDYLITGEHRFDAPPRRAQNRSSFWHSLAIRNFPSGVTILYSNYFRWVFSISQVRGWVNLRPDQRQDPYLERGHHALLLGANLRMHRQIHHSLQSKLIRWNVLQWGQTHLLLAWYYVHPRMHMLLPTEHRPMSCK